MAVATILLAGEKDPRIRIVASLFAPGEIRVELGLDRLVLSEHQAYELEAALARHRVTRAARRHVRKTVDVAPIPAEAATGCEVDADDLLESMASSYEVRRDQAGATNCQKEVP